MRLPPACSPPQTSLYQEPRSEIPTMPSSNLFIFGLLLLALPCQAKIDGVLLQKGQQLVHSAPPSFPRYLGRYNPRPSQAGAGAPRCFLVHQSRPPAFGGRILLPFHFPFASKSKAQLIFPRESEVRTSYGDGSWTACADLAVLKETCITVYTIPSMKR